MELRWRLSALDYSFPAGFDELRERAQGNSVGEQPVPLLDAQALAAHPIHLVPLEEVARVVPTRDLQRWAAALEKT